MRHKAQKHPIPSNSRWWNSDMLPFALSGRLPEHSLIKK